MIIRVGQDVPMLLWTKIHRFFVLVAVSIQREFVENGVRVRKYVRHWVSAKKSWMGVIHVILVMRIVRARNV